MYEPPVLIAYEDHNKICSKVAVIYGMLGFIAGTIVTLIAAIAIP